MSDIPNVAELPRCVVDNNGSSTIGSDGCKPIAAGVGEWQDVRTDGERVLYALILVGNFVKLSAADNINSPTTTTMGQSSYIHFSHVIFSTKHRTPFLTGERKTRTWKYMAGVARNLHYRPLIIGGVADHVHLLLQLNVRVLESHVIRAIKANSSRWIHETFSDLQDFGWQDGYGSYSISIDKVRTVTSYIRRQEEHHQRYSFDHELALIDRALNTLPSDCL